MAREFFLAAEIEVISALRLHQSLAQNRFELEFYRKPE